MWEPVNLLYRLTDAINRYLIGPYRLTDKRNMEEKRSIGFPIPSHGVVGNPSGTNHIGGGNATRPQEIYDLKKNFYCI